MSQANRAMSRFTASAEIRVEKRAARIREQAAPGTVIIEALPPTPTPAPGEGVADAVSRQLPN